MEYRITAKPRTSGNTTSNEILERIRQALGNLVWNFNIKQTYVDKDDPWSGILDAASFSILSTTNMLKGYILGQLVVVHCNILLIKHMVDWVLIRQR